MTDKGLYVSYAPAEVSVWGSPEECVAGLRQVIAAGAGMLMLNPVFDDLEHPETFASENRPEALEVTSNRL